MSLADSDKDFMGKHFRRDEEQLKKEILTMGLLVEEALNKSLRSLFERDSALAHRVVQEDTGIDQKENYIEEECLKLLALYQPVADDLRFIITVLKVNSDLERMGDYSVNIAERASYLSKQEPLPFPPDLTEVSKKVQSMVHRSLNALVDRDVRSAKAVWEQDAEIDTFHRKIFHQLQEEMKKSPDHIDRLVPILSCFRYLERIADLATNISEDTIFLVEGEIVRHQLTSD